jgi:hypothetical protein
MHGKTTAVEVAEVLSTGAAAALVQEADRVRVIVVATGRGCYHRAEQAIRSPLATGNLTQQP